jgi:YhcH/YjgK/YiaL family protein
MIIDSLQNAELYSQLNRRFKRAFEFLQNPETKNLPPGSYELEGRDLYVAIHEYTTKAEGQGKWEAHRKHIDIQLMLEGRERIHIAPLEQMEQGDYNEAKDFLALSGAGEYLTLCPGQFMVLFPQDAHMPSMAAGEPSAVKKAVVKVALA